MARTKNMTVCNHRGARRGILKALTASGVVLLDQGLFSRSAVAQAPVDPRIKKIVTDIISVDMHNHTKYPFARSTVDVKPDPDIDLPGGMRAAGLSALCYCYCVDSPDKDGAGRPARLGDYYQYHLQYLGYMDRLLAKHNMRRALNLSDLKAAHARAEPIIIQSAEGAHFLEGHIERVEEVYKRGLRHLQLFHQIDDLVAPLGDLQNNEPTKYGGLTSFGADVIKECNRLGIVVDLAHAHESTVMGALKVATQPLIVSHTGLNSPIGRGATSNSLAARLVSKEHAKAVADAGGVVGVWHIYKTMKEFVMGIRDMVDVIGVDHVGIGTDSEIARSPYQVVITDDMWPDENDGFLYSVVSEMLRQGFHVDEISKIAGGNYCRVFDKATATKS